MAHFSTHTQAHFLGGYHGACGPLRAVLHNSTGGEPLTAWLRAELASLANKNATSDSGAGIPKCRHRVKGGCIRATNVATAHDFPDGRRSHGEASWTAKDSLRSASSSFGPLAVVKLYCPTLFSVRLKSLLSAPAAVNGPSSIALCRLGPTSTLILNARRHGARLMRVTCRNPGQVVALRKLHNVRRSAAGAAISTVLQKGM